MKALTLWQPWASLVSMGEKKVETRCWETKYRGLIAIHSSAQLPPRWLGQSRDTEQFRLELADVLMCRSTHVESKTRLLPRASVLCIVRLHEIEETWRAREILCQRERIFGNYEDGRYAWFLEMVHKFETPIPAKGNRLLWNWEVPAEYEHLCISTSPEQTSIPLEVKG